MAKVVYNKGFTPYTITIENLAEHNSLVSLAKVRNELYQRVGVTFGSPFGHAVSSDYKELLYSERVLLNNLTGRLPDFK